ncbi:MAG: glycosyltransferase family 4 protein [Thermoanaerobaculia bacterium]
MHARIRVLEFVNSFHIGGTERQFVALVRGLAEGGHEVHVGCLRNRGQFRGELPSGLPVREYSIPSLKSVTAGRRVLELARYLRRHRIEVVHATNLYANVFAVAAGRLAGTPVVLASVVDLGHTWTPTLERAQRLVCRLADGVVVNARAVGRRLRDEGWAPERLHVIHNGVEARERPAGPGSVELREELGIPAGAPLVGVVSRLSAWKGVEHFVNAAALVARDHPEARFLVVGGPNVGQDAYVEELWRRTAALGLEERTVFTGFRTDVPKILPELTISVQPSLSEGLSNVILESMASGLPMVVTDVGGNPELIRDGVDGLVVPPADPPALAAAIGRLLADPERARAMGRSARRSASERFSLDEMVERTLALYRQLLDRPRRRAGLRRIPRAGRVEAG